MWLIITANCLFFHIYIFFLIFTLFTSNISTFERTLNVNIADPKSNKISKLLYSCIIMEDAVYISTILKYVVSSSSPSILSFNIDKRV